MVWRINEVSGVLLNKLKRERKEEKPKHLVDVPVYRQRMSVEMIFEELPNTLEFSDFLYELSSELDMAVVSGSLRYLDVELPKEEGTGQHIMLNWTTSGVSWYIWNKYNFATLEIYTCKRFDPQVVLHLLQEVFPIITWQRI